VLHESEKSACSHSGKGETAARRRAEGKNEMEERDGDLSGRRGSNYLFPLEGEETLTKD